MDEILVDRREVVAMAEHVDQLLAHAHQRGGPGRRQIEPAKQFLTARLRSGMDLGNSCVGRPLPPSGDSCLQASRIGAETFSQRFEEGDARSCGQFAVAA